LDNNTHKGTFKKWQAIDRSAWTNSSEHQTMQQAQETTPQKHTVCMCITIQSSQKSWWSHAKGG